MNKHVLALTIALILSGAPAAHADSAADIEALRQAIEKQQAQLDEQRKQLEELRAQQAQADEQKKQLAALQASKVATQDAPRASMPYNKPTLTTSDGRSSVSLKALVQADYAHYEQSSSGALGSDFRRGSVGATPNRDNQSARDLSDGMYFRRARAGIEGVLNRDFNYRLVFEFGGNGTEGPARINDAWINYTGFAPFTLQVGAGAPPANLDDGTPPEDTLFIERASPSDLSRSLAGADGRTGVGIRGSGARWFSAVTLTGRTVNDAEVSDSQTAIVSRFAGLLATTSDYNVHVGASGTYVIHPPDAGSDASNNRYGVRFRNQPELRVDSTRLIDSGTIDAQHAYAIGAEFAANWRNFLIQSERFWYGIERRNSALNDPKFNGWYVQGSWVITGESHRYNMASASFQNPRPYINAGNGWGAWELAMRYSRTDLDYLAGDEGLATPAGGVRGGIQDNLTLGVNWYVNANIKVALNYLHIDVDRLNPSTTAFGAAPASPPRGVKIGQDLDAYALRIQYSL